MNKTGRIRNPFATSEILLKAKMQRCIQYFQGRILDYGAGYGQYSEYLRSLGYTVSLYEPDQEMQNLDIGYLEEHQIRYHYDTVLLMNVLHHVEDINDFLKKFDSLTDRLIIGELNGSSNLVKWYHRLFLPDEVGSHLEFSDLHYYLVSCNDWVIVDEWYQNIGPFKDAHMFLVVDKVR